MTNLEIYNEAFMATFSVADDVLQTLEYSKIPEWDSVGHMVLISALEEKFNILLETDDIVDFSSYEKGKEILKKYSIEV